MNLSFVIRLHEKSHRKRREKEGSQILCYVSVTARLGLSDEAQIGRGIRLYHRIIAVGARVKGCPAGSGSC